MAVPSAVQTQEVAEGGDAVGHSIPFQIVWFSVLDREDISC